MMLKKLNGTTVEVDFSLIAKKIKSLTLLPGHELRNVNYLEIAKQTIAHFGQTTTELDEIAALTAADMTTRHYEYSLLAARIWCSRLHKLVPVTFSEATNVMVKNSVPLSSRYVQFVKHYANHLNPLIRPDRDLYEFDYFGVRTLAKSYLLRLPIEENAKEGKQLSFDDIAETPQQLFMRVAITVTIGDRSDLYELLTTEQLYKLIGEIKETYNALSTKRYVHATPTLFTAGLESQTLASCYLLTIGEDSIEGIFEALTKCALVSKCSGGIGLNISEIRANGTPIRRTNGRSNGIVPMLRVFNDVARYVDQGGGKRPGAITVYLEPWHADFEDFLRLSKKTGVEEKITRDLFTAVWCCDLFMRRVEANEDWSLMCPHQSPGLTRVWGQEFERLYISYENKKRYVKRVPAKRLWELLVKMQLETGMPFLLHKDHVNARNNHMNLGTIRGSNLCTEITLYTDRDSVSVCNLASISLSSFARDATEYVCECSTTNNVISMTANNNDDATLTINKYSWNCKRCYGGFDFHGLFRTVCLVVRNLDRTIDAMTYPFEAAERTNKLSRPLGIGVQGLADVFAKLRLTWDSIEAWLLNERIFETMYRASLQQSCLLAEQHGAYPLYEGSPANELPAKFQHDLYNEWSEAFMQNDTRFLNRGIDLSGYHYVEEDVDADWLIDATNKDCWSWSMLRKMVEFHGLRNSHRLAPMPTASTAQILGNCESIEPRTTNLFYRRVQSGEFFVINRQLIDDLVRLNAWDEKRRQNLIKHRGSVQQMLDIPQHLRNVYRTVWEIPQRILVNLNAARQPFVDQSLSFNMYFAEPNFSRITNAHFYAWRSGLKTGMYYLRTRPAIEPIQFSLDKNENGNINNDNSTNDRRDNGNGDNGKDNSSSNTNSVNINNGSNSNSSSSNNNSIINNGNNDKKDEDENAQNFIDGKREEHKDSTINNNEQMFHCKKNRYLPNNYEIIHNSTDNNSNPLMENERIEKSRNVDNELDNDLLELQFPTHNNDTCLFCQS